MDDFELGFCVGLYEGEGFVAKCGGGSNGVQLGIKMTDREPLEEFQRIMGGTIYGPYKNYGKSRPEGFYKPIWHYCAKNWSDVIRITNLLQPHLSPRRSAQIDTIMLDRPRYPRGERACPITPCNDKGRGYNRHRGRKEPPCDVCRESLRIYFRERDAAKRLKLAAEKSH